MKVTVTSTLKVINNSKKVSSTVQKCIQKYTDDLGMVAMSRTPVDEGNLEKSMTKKVMGTVGTVSFKATNKGFNYAEKMHNGKYKLGARSKSKRAMRSKYSSKSFAVGSKFLVNTALSCQDGYTKDLNEEVGKILK